MDDKEASYATCLWAFPIERPVIQHAFIPFHSIALLRRCMWAQQLCRAFCSSANRNVVVTRHVLLLTLLVDDRDPTTGTGDRLYHYSHSRSLSDRGLLSSIHQGGRQDPFHSSLLREFFAGPPFDNNVICLASYDSSRTTLDRLLRASLLLKSLNACRPRRAINDSSTN
jgi:hypothetical protein